MKGSKTFGRRRHQENLRQQRYPVIMRDQTLKHISFEMWHLDINSGLRRIQSDYLSAKQEYLYPRVRIQGVKRPFPRCPYTHCTHRRLRWLVDKTPPPRHPFLRVKPNPSKHTRLPGILLYSTTAEIELYFISHPPLHDPHPTPAVLKTWPQNS